MPIWWVVVIATGIAAGTVSFARMLVLNFEIANLRKRIEDLEARRSNHEGMDG